MLELCPLYSDHITAACLYNLYIEDILHVVQW
jgi:hypothetical protein